MASAIDITNYVWSMVLRFYFLFFLLISAVITGCKSQANVERETIRQSILYKQLLTDSSRVEGAAINGQMQISGNKNIPAVFITFNAKLDLTARTSLLQLTVLSKPLIDLYMKDQEFTLVNHTQNNYVVLKEETVDFSKILGFNFNPVELIYFLLGKIPYSPNMQLINITESKSGYTIQITDETSNYSVATDLSGQFFSAEAGNQFYDTISIQYLSYTDSGNDSAIPQRVKVSPVSGTPLITFIIRSADAAPVTVQEFTNTANYVLLDDPEKLEIKLK